MTSLVRWTRSRSLLTAVAPLALAAALGGGEAGCSSSTTIEPNRSANTGSVGMELTLPGGEQINSVNWTLTGPNYASTVVATGTASVGDSSTITFNVSIPSGTNYFVTATGKSADGTATCLGGTGFDATSRTTNVSVTLQCYATASEAGSARVTAPSFDCGIVTSISASPAEVHVGATLAITSTAAAVDPRSLVYAWTAPSGSFDNAHAANPVYTCTALGPVTLTLTLSDGSVPDGSACSFNTSSIQILCD